MKSLIRGIVAIGSVCGLVVLAAFAAHWTKDPADDNPKLDYSMVKDYPAEKTSKQILEEMSPEEKRAVENAKRLQLRKDDGKIFSDVKLWIADM